MVYCSLLKYLKLFYISVASFHASSTLVRGPDGKTIAFQNMMRSTDGIVHHKYTFLSNASYAKCFRDPREHTWLYKDPKSGFKVVAFSSSITPSKPSPTPTKPIRIAPAPALKPITRGSPATRATAPPKHHQHHEGDSSSSDDE